MSIPETTFTVLQEQLDLGSAVEDAMRALLDACAAERPHEAWDRLRTLDYRTGARALQSWLDEVLASEPPPQNADALWFGLFTAVYDGEDARSDVYVQGAVFDPDDGDWICSAVWKPKGRYAHHTLLRDAYRIAYETPGDNVGVDAEYAAVFGFAALGVAAWARDAATHKAPVTEQRRQLVVGFDDGDVLHVGEIDAEGFRRPRVRFPSVS